MSLEGRAAVHAALGDERRSLIIDQLGVGDRTVAELGEIVGMPGNLLAHHLHVLEEADLIERRVSEGDHRRRYVTLRWDRLAAGNTGIVHTPQRVAFVCTHNSARSQFAAAVWEEVTGQSPASAGTEPVTRVHPKAVRVAAEHGVDIGDRRPSGYDTLPANLDLVVSVCDRVREAGVPTASTTLHWSIPDPVPIGTLKAFRSSFDEIARRVEHLTSHRT
jgi:protein-tyrosine-phosphatase/DNA-binding transcriptional ArsR family regulator